MELIGSLDKDVPDVGRYAERHAALIRDFGRFPHRNAVLSRASTPAELEYLAKTRSSFSKAMISLTKFEQKLLKLPNMGSLQFPRSSSTVNGPYLVHKTLTCLNASLNGFLSEHEPAL